MGLRDRPGLRAATAIGRRQLLMLACCSGSSPSLSAPIRRCAVTDIGEAIENAVIYLTEHPDKARYTDSVARATLEESLRVTVKGTHGERLETDMPRGVGGKAEHPSPGWIFRAAIASCVASTVAMEAARAGITLTSLQVEVDSVSDDRGILGMDSNTPVGPLSTSVRITGSADGVDTEALREVLDQGARRCPVCDATKRSVEVTVGIEAL